MDQQISQNKIRETVESFRKLDEKISHYTNILGLLGWDARTGAPKKGRPLFAKAKGTLSTEVFQLSISPEMGKYLKWLSEPEITQQLDEVTKACVRVRKHAYEKSKSIPPELYNEYVVLVSNATDAWEEARARDDFEHFRPFLEKVVDLKKKFIDYYGYKKHPYDALLDDFEPGLTVGKLDPLFGELREKSLVLLDQIKKSGQILHKEMFHQSFPIHKQKEFLLSAIQKLGYDMEAGRLDETTHPFAQAINTGDVRITTRYEKYNIRMALFGTIHETGHALYEQGINPDYEGTVIRRGASYGIHESQSRFLENMVGRSEAFWKHLYKDLQSYFPEQLNSFSKRDFYEAANYVEPSLIRVEADELTYNLHIMIRYEIEKALISGEIEVKELPLIWTERMQEYLGVTPSNQTLGVLQDVHWSQGSFGYFPSYALGNLYAAQILNTAKQELPDFYSIIENGEFMKIRNWLKENIHQYGKLYTPGELIQKVTGEELNAKYLIDYLEEKYADIYRF